MHHSTNSIALNFKDLDVDKELIELESEDKESALHRARGRADEVVLPTVAKMAYCSVSLV